MKNYKELIKTFKKEDYEQKRVNLHIHSLYSDGVASFQEIEENAAKNGIQYYAISDHNTLQGHIENPNSSAIPAIEFDVWYKGIFLHLLAYGIDVNNKELLKFCAKSKRETTADIVRLFSNRKLPELINAIHNAGGIAVLAHPCCCWAISLDHFIKTLVTLGLDGVEVYYPYPRWRKYIKFSSPDCVEEIADKYNLIKTGGTDCHSKDF